MNIKKAKILLQESGLYILMVLLFLLPLHAFGSVFLNYGYGLADFFGTSTVVSMWKEYLIVILSLLFGAKLIFEKKLPKLDVIDKLIFAYIGFGFLHYVLLQFGVFGSTPEIGISQFVWGARYDYMFLWVFLIVRHFGFSKDQVKLILKITLLGGILSLMISYFVHFLIKPENLTFLGFRNDWSTWYPGQSLAFCQRLENQETCRMSGVFAGPNQLGAYMVILLTFIYMWRKKLKKIKTVLLSIAVLIALYLSYSRGAYLGAMVVFIVLLANEFKLLKYSKYLIYGSIALLSIGLLILSLGGVSDTFLRPESTGEHFAAWALGIREIIAHPFGQGLGTAGPASYRFDNSIIPENWYLQVGVELGLIGLVLFVSILIQLAKKLLKKQHITVLAGLLGVLTIALFLHTFEDSAVSITLFAILGLSLQE